MKGRCIDIKPICDCFEVAVVFKDSIFNPTYDNIINRGKTFLNDKNIRVAGYEEDGLLLGGIAYKITTNSAIIKNISTDGGHRHRGIGRYMIEQAFKDFHGEIIAKTDIDAVNFYKRCGFEIKSLGNVYPDASPPYNERFECKLIK